MQYFGGKQRISKELSYFLNSQLKDGQTFVDLFCGSCNVISKIDSNRKRVANDKHKYLISMWKELQKGWIPPNGLTIEEYKHIQKNKDLEKHLTGFVGFGCSFAGKWFGGYAKSNNRNYCLNAHNSVLNKVKKLEDVTFYNLDYSEIETEKGSLIYCDIPYKDATKYCSNEVGEFNHSVFYEWVRKNSNIYDIFVSEYKENVPNDFIIVWEKESKKDIRNKDNKRENTIEVVIKYKERIEEAYK